nr:UUP1 family membrane protein [Deltaproteobacteria bacterium]
MKSVFKRNRIHLIIALFFLLLFLVPAAYKIFVLKYPVISRSSENLWAFELKINFRSSGKKDTLRHFLPKSEKGQTVLNENFVSEHFYFVIEREEGNIGITWKGDEHKGDMQLYYRATIETEPAAFSLPPRGEEKKYSAYIFQYLFLDEGMESVNVELSEFLGNLLQGTDSKLERARRIYTFLTRDVATVPLDKGSSLTTPIQRRQATISQKNKLFIHLCRLSDIPTRSVHGILLEEGIRQRNIHTWAEVYFQGMWIPIDIEKELFARLPDNILILYRGDDPFMTSAIKGIEYSYTVSRDRQSSFAQFYESTARLGSKFHEWSLFSLPVETQQVFRLILMIPLGAVVVSIFRNLIGINTFGTFMPVLIALAFRNTRLGWGLLLFSMVIILGLASRWYMDRLKLLLVPRLSIIVTVLVIILAVGSIIGQHVGVYRIMAVALFPMVIMTMTIERLSLLLMERGWQEALKVSMGTLAVAVFSFFVLSIHQIQEFFFAFPETLFALIAVQVLLGRYTGYRLTEYFRFSSFINGKSS